VLILVLIFFTKILEVSLMTLRTVLLTRGEKLWASIIGFIEVLLYLYLISYVLIGISENPMKIIVYSLGFASGNYIGSILEEKLAIGLVTVNIITSVEDGEYMAEVLRKKDIGITMVDAYGKNEARKMLIIHIRRKKKDEVLRLVQNEKINSVISVNDTKLVYGGYGLGGLKK
jgi:uncharacterized protein YebE (UPF0316 family)